MLDLTGDAGPGRTAPVSRPGRVPLALGRCRRAVAVTVRLAELLGAAGGVLQRLDGAGVPIDLLELLALDSAAELAAGAALRRLELGNLARHRLALSAPLRVEHTGDVVAAASELIGFDPEPGVLCLVPGPGGGPQVRPDHQAVDAAAAAIGAAYRVRVMWFAPTPEARASVLELGSAEWERKRDSLAAFAEGPTAAVGRREYLVG